MKFYLVNHFTYVYALEVSICLGYLILNDLLVTSKI